MRYQDNVIPLSSQDGKERHKMAKSKKPCFTEDKIPWSQGGLQSDNKKFWPFKNQYYLRKVMEYITTSSFVSGTVWIGIGCQFMFVFHIWSPSGGYNPARLLAALISVLSTSVDWTYISSREYASGRNPVYLSRSHWPNSYCWHFPSCCNHKQLSSYNDQLPNKT